MLNFLNKLQDRYLLILCFAGTMAFYAFMQLDAILQLGINFAVAFIAIASKRSEQPQPIEVDTLQAQELQTEKIDNSVINTDSISPAVEPAADEINKGE